MCVCLLLDSKHRVCAYLKHVGLPVQTNKLLCVWVDVSWLCLRMFDPSGGWQIHCPVAQHRRRSMHVEVSQTS